MAKFIDQRPEDDDDEFTSLDVRDDEVESSEPVKAQTTSEDTDEIPEKYRGKDLREVVRMHQEAEKLLGRQSKEVGELRQTYDQYIKAQLAKEEQAHASTTPQVEEVDFFEDPQKAVEYAIANHPKIKEAETASQRLKMQEALAKLKSEHTDFAEILQNEEFASWVSKSKFRTDLLRRGDQQYDYEALDELLTSWKERQSVVTETVQNETKARKNQVKTASTGDTRGSGEAPSRKIYRRADIMKLMQTDPDRYIQLAPEIRQAYAEKRVK